MNTYRLSAIARTRIRRPPSSVFAAFANAREMSKIWFTRRDDGVNQGESVSWFIGNNDDAISFDVHVKELSGPNTIVIEWLCYSGNPTQVTWSFEESEEGDTILSIEETGFSGNDKAIVKQALDSIGGFNQVIIAAKALIEHGVELNVVADHV